MAKAKAKPRQLYLVKDGPYKNLTGWMVDAAEVRGEAGRVYLESEFTSDIYELMPHQIMECKRL